MTQLYHSTRQKNDFVTSPQAILQGIAKDGGLFVTDELEGAKLATKLIEKNSFTTIATEILGAFFDELDGEQLKAKVAEAYSRFSAAEVTPVTALGERQLLELYHGPTSAFKDVALQILPKLMELSRAKVEKKSKTMILTATSGDTGKAALAGFQDIEDTAICVFYPEGGVSDVQKLQMLTQEGKNVSVCAIRGNFDDAQSGVKEIFANAKLAEELSAKNISLSSANSINIGRLVPQISYYVYAYAALLQAGKISKGESLDFVVPTGNFGDIFAGYLAKDLGLPVGKLVVASNKNKVLTDFIETGIYDRRREFYKTISPSMDILISSNLERLLYFASDKDAELVASLMTQLKQEGFYQVPKDLLARIRESFAAGFADDEKTKAAIHKSFYEEGRLIDPHTAVARSVADELGFKSKNTVILSTANPYKFARDVLSALDADKAAACESGFAAIDTLNELTGEPVPQNLALLRDKEILHHDVIEAKDMAAYVQQKTASLLA